MSAATNCYMEIWRSMKPVVAKIQRAAIGGGSDIALACDVTFIEASAKIGYPPSVIWGCPTTAFWAYRVGMERAKRILFTGIITIDLILTSDFIQSQSILKVLRFTWALLLRQVKSFLVKKQ